jgi:hypothetical protein
MPPRIEIRLPSDRNKVGTIVLRDSEGRVIAGPYPAIGRASPGFRPGQDPNPSRDPLQPYGHTPTGTYYFRDTVPSGAGTKWNPESYGRSGVVRLWPRSGEANEAAENGRTGIHIHSRANDNGVLKGTSGCVRVTEADMANLVASIAIIEAIEGPFNACHVEESNDFIVTVETDYSEDSVEPDPPIGAETDRSSPGTPPRGPRPRPGNPRTPRPDPRPTPRSNPQPGGGTPERPRPDGGGGFPRDGRPPRDNRPPAPTPPRPPRSNPGPRPGRPTPRPGRPPSPPEIAPRGPIPIK